MKSALRKHRKDRHKIQEQRQGKRRRQKERRWEKQDTQRQEDLLIIEEERRKRDPINESSVVLSATQVEVARLLSKFVPMPRWPVDLGDLNRGYETFANNMRWRLFHHKRKHAIQNDHDEDEEDHEDDDNFVMTPWYRRSARRAPRGNPQLEAGLERLRRVLNDPNNRRRVKDNMTPEQRDAMEELGSLPVTSQAQVVFEDKGNRFVVRDLEDQDNQILE